MRFFVRGLYSEANSERCVRSKQHTHPHTHFGHKAMLIKLCETFELTFSSLAVVVYQHRVCRQTYRRDHIYAHLASINSAVRARHCLQLVRRRDRSAECSDSIHGWTFSVWLACTLEFSGDTRSACHVTTSRRFCSTIGSQLPSFDE